MGMTKTKATKTQKTVLQLIAGQRVTEPAPRFIVNALITGLELGWVSPLPGYSAEENFGQVSSRYDHYELTATGQALI